MAIQPISHGPGSFTYADLEQTPDDGNRYELCDGVLLVTPSPATNHQWLLGRLVAFLLRSVDAGEKVLPGVDVYMSETHVRVPDLVVVDDRHVRAKNVVGPPRIAVEILSPSTRRIDLHLKRYEYAEFGIAEYWLADPDAATITVLQLVDGIYVEADSALAADAAAAIFG
jgi:Uma2 family endonuclease